MNEISAFTTTDIANTWLNQFSSAVRERDYIQGRQLFASDVLGFGTYSSTVEGLEALEAHQWRHIWDATRNFSFDLESMKCGGNEEVIWVAVLWHSQGQNENGEWFDRNGRASFALECRDGVWLAVHSHHSLAPKPNPKFPAGVSY